MALAVVPDGLWYGVAEIDALYRTAPIGLCVVDRELRFVRLNERFAQMTGIAPAEHIGKTVRELLPTLADQAEPVLRRAMESDETIIGVELRGQTPAMPGVERTWIDNFAPLKDASGRVAGVNISVEEVTELRALQVKQREEQLMHALARALQRAREEDRASIARELHDEIGQLLVVAALELQTMMGGAASVPAERLEGVRARLVRGAEAVRRISEQLRPAALDVRGIGSAIGEHVGEFRKATGIEVVLHVPPGEPALPRDGATALFRVLQEALANVARRSGASKVEVTLRDESEAVALIVHDNGKGMPAAAGLRRGLGLLGMTERMRAQGGELAVTSNPGQGMYLTASLPRRA